MKKIISLSLLIVFSGAALAVTLDPKIDDLLSRIKNNQQKIKDMRADITTTVNSGGKKMERKGRLMVKGEKMSKMEVFSPKRQITITSGDKTAMIDPETGRKFVQDIKKLREKTGQSDLGSSPTDQTKALDYFNLTMKKEDKKSVVIEGKPKKPNIFVDKVEFVIDTERNLPVEVKIFNLEGNEVSNSKLEYRKVKNIWVLSKNYAQVSSPRGKMEIEMDFSNIKLNEGIPDKEFKID